MRTLQHKTRKAFTLIEVLVALVILTTALLLAIELLSFGNLASAKANNELVALRLANEKLAELQQSRFLDINQTINSTLSLPSLPNGSMAVTSTALDGLTSNSGIRTLEVTVSWTEPSSSGAGSSRSIRLSGYLADRR